MMKSIRNLVFETNSSSTHSLTIRRLSEDKRTIPYDSKLNVCEEVDYQGSDTIMNEMDKLRYMVQMIALQLDELGIAIKVVETEEETVEE